MCRLIRFRLNNCPVSIFGMAFSVFAQMGKPHLIFLLNAVSAPILPTSKTFSERIIILTKGVAALAAFILAFSHFPPRQSHRIEGSQAHESPGIIITGEA